MNIAFSPKQYFTTRTQQILGGVFVIAFLLTPILGLTNHLSSEALALKPVTDGCSYSDKCSYSGQHECVSNNSYHICGDYDSDGCLEWSQDYYCYSNETCSNGQCVQENQKPDADLSHSPSNPSTEDTISFIDQSSDGDGWISSYSWSFGDGSGSSQTNPSHSYYSSGNYTVTLTVTDNDGVTDSTSETISVGSSCSSQCSYSGEKECINNDSYHVCGDYNSDGCLEWSSSYYCSSDETCQNGSCVTKCSSHEYKSCYNNDVYWYDSCDNRGSKYEECGSDSWTDEYRCSGDMRQRKKRKQGCSYSSCYDYYNWEDYEDCGSQGMTCSSGQCVISCSDQCSYPGQQECSSDNSYHVCGDYDSDNCLEWDSDNFCSSGETCQNGECVQENQPPTANFSYNPSNPDTNDSISFTDQSSDSDGWISSYSWSFGDGNSSNQQNPNHSYNNAGNYTVTLTVTDNDGSTDSTSKSISVSISCQNECSYSDQRECTDNNSYHVCGYHDSDSCLEWSSIHNCSSNQICQNGSCVIQCSAQAHKACSNNDLYWYDSCNQRGSKTEECGTDQWTDEYRCSGDIVQRKKHNQGCSSSSCYDHYQWINYENCANQGKTCSNGQCETTCTDQCSWSDQRRCSSSNNYQTCGDYDSDSCLEWSSSSSCEQSNSCGHGRCNNNQRPSWYCSSGNCNYNCNYSSSCDFQQQDHLACYNQDVYWYDSNYNREDKYRDCGSNYCNSWRDNYCSNNNVYRKRTCYNKGCAGGSCYSNSYSDRDLVENCDANQTCQNGECVEQQECSSGPCCKNGHYQSDDEICDTETETQYGCPWGQSCGADLAKRTKTRFRYCSGSSASCTGSWSSWQDWTSWTTAEVCSSKETCSVNNERCQSNSNCVQPSSEGPQPAGLVVSLSAKESRQTTEWQKSLLTTSNQKINFLITVTNTGSDSIKDINLRTDLTESISYQNEIKSEGKAISGNITRGIILDQLAPETTQTLTFKAKTKSLTQPKQVTVEAKASTDNFSDSDSVQVKIKKGYAFSNPLLAALRTITEVWYGWPLIILIAIALWVILSRAIDRWKYSTE